MEKCKDSTKWILPLIEPDQYIYKDKGQCKYPGIDWTFLDIISNGGTHFCWACDVCPGIIRLHEQLLGEVTAGDRIGCFIDLCIHFVLNIGTCFIDQIACSDIIGIRSIDGLDDGWSTKRLGQFISECLHINILIKLDVVWIPAFEIDTQFKSTGKHGDQTDNNKYPRSDISYFPFAKPIHIDVRKMILRRFRPEGDIPAFLYPPVNDQSSNEDSSEEWGNNTNNQDYRKSLDGTQTKVGQNKSNKYRRNVGINDRRIGMLETIRYCCPKAFSGSQFFTGTLIDDNVGIHCHTYRQYDTSYTW